MAVMAIGAVCRFSLLNRAVTTTSESPSSAEAVSDEGLAAGGSAGRAPPGSRSAIASRNDPNSKTTRPDPFAMSLPLRHRRQSPPAPYPQLAILAAQNRGLNLPLDPVFGSRRTIHRHRANPARARLVRDQPGVELTRLARGKTEQQVELALGNQRRAIDALVTDDEITLIGRGSDERALLRKRLEKCFCQRPRPFPGRRTVVFEDDPTRALLNAGGNEQR